MANAEEHKPLERIAADLKVICASIDKVADALRGTPSSSPSKTEEAGHDNCASDKNDPDLKAWHVIVVLLTFLFAAAPYLVVMWGGIPNSETSQVAIAALMIEAPIQSVVLLCILLCFVFPRRKQTAAPANTSQDQDGSETG